jgi:predicted transcriptional regulator YdeE
MVLRPDGTGRYTILIGVAIKEGTPVPPGFTSRRIQRSKYRVISTKTGQLSEIGIDAWQRIWSDSALKKNRTFKADLEICGSDARNPSKARFDILLGIR